MEVFNLDFLAKKREYIFLNNQSSLVRVHVTKVASSPYNIWVEGKSKNYRDCVTLLEKALKYLDNENIPSIIIIDNKKLGKGSISSYSYKDDIIFFNNYYHSLPKIERLTKQNILS